MSDQKRWMSLFEGLMKGEIPFDGTGFILVANFSDNSNYAIVEVVAFRNIKQFIQTDDGVTFYSDGYKIYLLYEPVSYRFRFQEPYLRDQGEAIPMRFNELHIFDMPSHDRVLMSISPYVSMGTFYIEKPHPGNLVVYFFDRGDAHQNMDQYLTKLLSEDLKVPRSKMREVLNLFHKNLEHFQKATVSEPQ